MPPIDKRKPVLVPEQNTPDKPLLLLLPPLEKTLYGRGYVCITLCVCVCAREGGGEGGVTYEVDYNVFCC